MLDKIALFLTIVGGIVWGIIGIFDVNVIDLLFSDKLHVIARIIYSLVGISALWSISLLFEPSVHSTWAGMKGSAPAVSTPLRLV